MIVCLLEKNIGVGSFIEMYKSSNSTLIIYGREEVLSNLEGKYKLNEYVENQRKRSEYLRIKR